MLGSMRTVNGKDSTYVVAQLLGQGQFGKVYRAQQADSSNSVAIKIIRRNKFLKNQKLKHLLQRQMAILADFNHENIIQLLELIVEKQQVCIVYEYCDGGTLEDKIPISQNELFDICCQIFDAMIEADENFIIHRDLKPANILFKNGKVKIADWGFSRLLESGETTRSFIGSPAYMAPQVLKGYQYSQKADIWSLGIVLYECLTGTCPWKSHNITQLSQEIKTNKLSFPKNINISDSWKEIISKMIAFDPSQRPSFKVLRQKLQKFRSIPKNTQQFDHSSIISCVLFLELVQWSRKNVTKSSQFQLFIKLIQQNLCKIRQITHSKDQLMHILQKEIKVVNNLKRKIQEKNIKRQKSLTHISAFSLLKTQQDEQNPEGIWEFLVKKTIKYVIDELELIYLDKQGHQKQEKLIKFNLLLDLIAFTEIPDQYLQKTFENYLIQLKNYNKKTLLKLINFKLQLINKKYYQ